MFDFGRRQFRLVLGPGLKPHLLDKAGKRKSREKGEQRDLFSADALPEIRKELAAILDLLK